VPDLGQRASAPFVFNFKNLQRDLTRVVGAGYASMTCADYVRSKASGRLAMRSWINRVDVDFSLTKAAALLDIFSNLGIKATFFVRLHAPEYNPFSFENYIIISRMICEGHELGYHSEIVDQGTIWNEDAADCLRRDLHVMRMMFGVPIVGIASHSGNTGHNNLHFWDTNKPEDFDLLYEAYDRRAFNAFHESVYVSDSEWTRWKCYRNGTRVESDGRSIGDHASDGPSVIYSLIHSDTYFNRHFYEDDRR